MKNIGALLLNGLYLHKKNLGLHHPTPIAVRIKHHLLAITDVLTCEVKSLEISANLSLNDLLLDKAYILYHSQLSAEIP